MMVDAVRQSIQFTPDLVKRLSHRQFGIGFDQLLVVEKAQREDVDFRYRIFNADGGEVQQCGNGARCFVQFARLVGLTDKSTIRVETANGLLELAAEADGFVTVNMGAPIFEHAQIPFTFSGPPALQYELHVNGGAVRLSSLSMGNPHAVLFVNDVDQAPLSTQGPAVQAHPNFPEGVNVGYGQVLDQHTLKLRVWERGAGETLACGSGACAAAVAGIRLGYLQSPVRILARGGELSIAWAGQPDSPVMMSGGTAVVFSGVVEV